MLERPSTNIDKSWSGGFEFSEKEGFNDYL